MSTTPSSDGHDDRSDDDPLDHDPLGDETPEDGPGPGRGGVRTVAGMLVAFSALALGSVLAMIAVAAPASAASAGAAFVAVVVVGPSTMVWLSQGGSDRWAVAVAGAAATAAVVASFLVIAGVVVVLGNVSALLLPVAALAAAAWLRTRHDLPGRIRSVADRAGARARSWFLRDGVAVAGPPDPSPSAAHALLSGPPVHGRRPTIFSDENAVTTGALCRAWHDSYWLLTDTPHGPERNDLVVIRSLLLDELERRDPTGFRRRLDSGPRAGSDPRSHLGGDPATRPRSDDHG